MNGILGLFSFILITAPNLSLPATYTPSGSQNFQGKRQGIFFAAAGEYERVTLRMDNDAQERRLLSCAVMWGEDEKMESSFFRLATPGDFLPGTTPVADAYVPLNTVLLEPNATLELLLVLHVPRNAKPGLRRGVVQARFQGGVTARHAITVRVFDFLLPERHTLPVLFSLDLKALARFTGNAMADLDAWTPFYDSLSELGFACQLWPESDIGTDILSAHSSYVAVAMPAAAVVDVGGEPGYLARHLISSSPGGPQDALQIFLHDILGRLAVPGVQALPVACPSLFGKRTAWQHIRQDYARFSRADERVMRVLASPAHPHFERYTDIWALPESTAPGILKLLASGRSMIRYEQHDVSMCVGSEGALDRTGSYQSLASEAVDGSEATAWIPARLPGDHKPWLEVTFRDLSRVERLTILYNAATSQEPPLVETAYRAGEFAAATLRWKRGGQMTESGLALMFGSFRYPRACRAIRLRFPVVEDGASVEIAEVLINNDTRRTVDTPIEPIVPWLDASASTYPVWNSTKAVGEEVVRALPWRCWALNFRGLLGPTLNQSVTQAVPLVGIGVNQLLPTRRLFALRDGMEDFDYLQLYWDRVFRKTLKAPSEFAPGRGEEALDLSGAGGQRRRETREKLGRLLSGETLVRKNFGP